MASNRTVVPQLERLTKAIGYVCVYWAWLEDQIGEMILDLAPLDPKRIVQREANQLRDVLLTDTDIRTKIKVLRAAAFIRKWDDGWFNQVDKTLNKIDNDIRVRRNRVVHSSWFVPKGRLQRRRKVASLKKPQAFAKAELATHERVPVKMAELWKLGRDIISAQIKLVRLKMRHDAIQKVVDEEVQKADADTWMQLIGQAIADDPSRLPALLEISRRRNPYPNPRDSSPKSKGAISAPRRRPSRKKPQEG